MNINPNWPNWNIIYGKRNYSFFSQFNNVQCKLILNYLEKYITDFIQKATTTISILNHVQK